DWSTGEKEFRRALELNPAYWVTPYWYGLILASMGRFEEAERQIRNGLALEPVSPIIMHVGAMICYVSQRYEEAVERCREGLESNPDYFLLRFWLGLARLLQDKPAEAISELLKAVDACGREVSWVLGGLVRAYAVSGAQTQALQVLEELLDRAKRAAIDYTSVGAIYMALGDTENALASLETACANRGMSGILLKVDPRFDPLRAEPRFQQVLRQMNLA